MEVALTGVSFNHLSTWPTPNKKKQGLIKIIASFIAKVKIGLKSSEIRFDFYEEPYVQCSLFMAVCLLFSCHPRTEVLTTRLASSLVCSQIYHYYYFIFLFYFFFYIKNMNDLSVSLFFGEKMSHGKVDATEKKVLCIDPENYMVIIKYNILH